jgi:hypothetical protein
MHSGQTPTSGTSIPTHQLRHCTDNHSRPLRRLMGQRLGCVVTEPDAFREFVLRRSPALLGSAWLLTGTGIAPRMQTALLTNWTR